MIRNSSIRDSLQACNATYEVNGVTQATTLDFYGQCKDFVRFLGTSFSVPLLISGRGGLVLTVATLRPYCSTIPTEISDRSEKRDMRSVLAPRQPSRRPCKETLISDSVQNHWLPHFCVLSRGISCALALIEIVVSSGWRLNGEFRM